MRRAGLQGVTGRPEVAPTPSPDLLASRPGRPPVRPRRTPNQLWVTDITEHPTREGKVYCAVVLDVFSRRVVGWSIDASPTAALVTNALGMAIDTRTPAGRRDHPLRPGRAVRLLGLHRPGQGLRAGALDGLDRRLLRQRR